MKKHTVTIEFYGKKYQIGIVAETRSQAVIEAMSKARSRIKICQDAENALGEIENQFANAAALINAKDIEGRLDDIQQKFKMEGIMGEITPEKLKKMLSETLLIFTQMYDVIDIVESMPDDLG